MRQLFQNLGVRPHCVKADNDVQHVVRQDVTLNTTNALITLRIPAYGILSVIPTIRPHNFCGLVKQSWRRLAGGFGKGYAFLTQFNQSLSELFSIDVAPAHSQGVAGSRCMDFPNRTEILVLNPVPTGAVARDERMILGRMN